MSLEAVALALLNAGRPAGIAVVYALVSAPAPRRLLAAYVVAGFAWSAAVGVLVVSVVHGVELGGDSTVTAVVDLIGGIAVLAFAVGFIRGRREVEAAGGPRSAGPRVPERLRHPSPAVAAGAGVATHLPGLFYLLGLNAIAAGDPDVLDGLIAVLVFNAIWFAIPVTSLVLSVRRPDTTRATLARVNGWARRHERAAVITFSLAVGVYFTIKGALDLIT